MMSSLIVFGLLGPHYLSFGLTGPGIVINVFPDPFGATITVTVDPFGARSRYKS